MKKLSVVALAALMSLALAGGASAHVNNGKGHKDAAAADGSTIALDQTAPSLGDDVTFTITVAQLQGTAYPMIELICTQDGRVVWATLNDLTTPTKLGGTNSDWAVGGGSADCVANLDAYDWQAGVESITVLASTSFQAGG